ncbi:MAG: iron-containing alcohol dehydrogenase [Fervidicoccaceae archaeon]
MTWDVRRSFAVRAGPTRLMFGVDVVGCLEPWLERFEKILLVTGRRSARESGALADVERLLRRCGVSYEHFDRVTPNPSEALVEEVAEAARGVEAIVAIGGGSVIDAAKLASVVAKCGGRVRDYALGDAQIRGALPLAAVNLTHGTGSEVDRYAVVTIDDLRAKIGVASDHMYPEISIDDPRYLLTLPRDQTTYTTLDAFYHAIESATSFWASPYTKLLAEEAVRLAASWLPSALENPRDLSARFWLLYASMIAGICIDNSRTHLIHAMEHALSGLRPELAHGAGLAMLGPPIVELIYKADPSTCCSLLRHVDPGLRPTADDSQRARRALEEFQKSVGFAETPERYGLGLGDVEHVKKVALEILGAQSKLAPFEVTPRLVEEIYREMLRSSSR